MPKKLVIGAALALVWLLAVTGNAAATFTATVSPAGAITATTSSAEFIGGSTTIRCPLTLRGSLNATVALTAGQSLGSVSKIEVGPCSGSSEVTALGLPYDLPFVASAGLPNEVAEVEFNVRGVSFNLGLFGGFINCLYAGNQPSILNVTGANPYATTTIEPEPTALNLIRGGFGCPSTGRMKTTFSLSPSQRVSIR